MRQPVQPTRLVPEDPRVFIALGARRRGGRDAWSAGYCHEGVLHGVAAQLSRLGSVKAVPLDVDHLVAWQY
jgi:hypothetical protein